MPISLLMIFFDYPTDFKYYGMTGLDLVSGGVENKLVGKVIDVGFKKLPSAESFEKIFKGFSFLFTTSTWGTAKGIIGEFC